MKNKIILGLILISAFLLRIYKLGQIPFWEDELWTLYRSSLSMIGTLKTLVSLPVHPPLYYLLMNSWVNLFGANEFTLRFPSIIFSLLSVFFIFKLGESLYNSRVGLYAALLLAVSPFNIYYSQEAKGYIMSWTLCLISFWLFYRLMKKFRAADLTAYILVTIVSWYTSYIGVVYSLIQFICFFMFQKPLSVKEWIGVYILIIGWYLFWLQIFLRHPTFDCIQWIGTTDNYFVRAGVHIDQMLHSPVSVSKRILPLSLITFVSLMLLPIAGFKKDSRAKFVIDIKREDIMLFAWFLFPFVFYFLIDKFWFHIFIKIRYIGFVHIPLLLLLGKGIDKLRTRWRIFIVVFLVCYTFLFSLYPYYAKASKKNDQRWADAFNTIEKINPPKSLVVVPIDISCLKYYKSNLSLIKASDNKTYIYEGRDLQSIFVLSRDGKKIFSVFLPEYFLYTEWWEGILNVRWYKLNAADKLD